MSRFERIAQDLEKLPCELHDGVLKDLEFEQLIRLSASAGPRLLWSLENSLSPWGKFFRDEGSIPQLQTLLGITDQVKKFCFQLPKSKKTDRVRHDTWPPANLTFLHHRDSDWSRTGTSRYRTLQLMQQQLLAAADLSQAEFTPADRPSFANSSALNGHWLRSLNEIVIQMTWQAFQSDYSRLIEPWVPEVEGAASIFAKVQVVGQVLKVDLAHAKRNALSLDELKNFMTFYQQLRETRAKALAQELCRLAGLYEAHPTCFKTPFAPERRRLNEKHVPTQMRIEARKMTKRVTNTWWKDKEIYKYRFAFPFPGLVPYGWTLQLFDKVLKEGHAVLTTDQHEEMFKKARITRSVLPAWAAGVPDMGALTQQVERWEPRYKAIMSWGLAYQPHKEWEVRWLETFGEVVAWMEAQFPDLLQEVRGPGWVVGAEA
jgi:hypothetical protein